jgi:hypothetical protein
MLNELFLSQMVSKCDILFYLIQKGSYESMAGQKELGNNFRLFAIWPEECL